MRTRIWWLVLLLGFWYTGSARAQTFVVDTQQDWERWSFPARTAEITEDGYVRPAFFAKNINACLNAATFERKDRKGNILRGGVRNAGSNPSTAPYVLDGDSTTSWGPSIEDEPDTWWVEIDLGRLVAATKIIVRFDETADPFEEFRIYTSDGSPAFLSVLDVLNYKLAGEVTRPNHEYVLEYALGLREIQYVYLLLTAWRDPETIPKMAELEVITLGDNVVLGTTDRGGQVIAGSRTSTGLVGGSPAGTLDGDGKTYWLSFSAHAFCRDDWYLHLDLGASFWVDTIMLVTGIPRVSGVIAPITYWMDVSDGTKTGDLASGWQARGPYVWEEIGQVELNERDVFIRRHEFASRPVERLFYMHRNFIFGCGGEVRLTEIQAFGEGYVPSVALESEFIDLGRPRNVTEVAWDADAPVGTKVEIRTRTGDELIEEVRYYDKDGKEVRDKNRNGTAQDEYEGLPPFRKGEAITSLLIGDDWSPWSPPYLRSGDAFLSPSPRRYLQLQARLLTGDPYQAVALDRIEISHTSPVATELMGEIWPPSARAPAVPDTFSYFIRPVFSLGQQGFDRVLVKTPSKAEVMEVRIADIPVPLDSVRSTSDSLLIHLPLVRRQSDPLVEITFRCAVFLNGTLMEAFVGHSSQPDAWQRVDPGNATDEVESETITVGLPITVDVLGDVLISPPTITPNEDGVNDLANIEFTVLKLNLARALRVTIYDVGGTAIRRLMDEPGASGSYRAVWDGRDDDDARVPPGIYLCRIEVGAAAEEAVLWRSIAVAY